MQGRGRGFRSTTNTRPARAQFGPKVLHCPQSERPTLFPTRVGACEPQASRDTGNGSGHPGCADELRGLGCGDHHAQKEALQVTNADRAALRRLVDSLACTRVVVTHGVDTLVRQHAIFRRLCWHIAYGWQPKDVARRRAN